MTAPSPPKIPPDQQPHSPRVLQVLLLDPDEADREWFRQLMLRHPSLHLASEVSDFANALQSIERLGIDLLILDATAIPNKTTIAEALTLVPPDVRLLFTTSDPALALQAFELDAVDFLLKPVAAPRLAESVRRLLRIDWPRRESAPPRGDAPVLIPFERGRRGISLNDISLIQAFGNYTRVSLISGETEIVLRSLAKWEEMLPSPPFLRIHRNALVQAKHIHRLEGDGTSALLHLAGADEPVPVSRRLLPGVRQTLFQQSATAAPSTVHPTSNHP